MKYPNLNAEMARRGTNPATVAAYLGVSAQTVRNWLQGKGCPSVDQAMELSGLFGMDIDYLFSQEPITVG